MQRLYGEDFLTIHEISWSRKNLQRFKFQQQSRADFKSKSLSSLFLGVVGDDTNVRSFVDATAKLIIS